MDDKTPDETPDRPDPIDSRNLSPAEREQASKICHELMEREFWRSQTTRLRIIEAAYASMADTYRGALAKNGGAWLFRPPARKGEPPPPPPPTDAELDAMIDSVREEMGIPEPVACAPTQPAPALMTLDQLIDSVPAATPTAEQMRKAFPFIDGLGDLSAAECDWARPLKFKLDEVLTQAWPSPGIRYKAVLAALADLLHTRLEAERKFASKWQSETS